MREIKFRLIKDGKIVGYEWHKSTKKGRIQLHHSKDGKKWKLIFDGASSHCGWIDHDDKEQFTGLKDKNGKESSHKDIIRRDTSCVKFTGILEWVENVDYDYPYPADWGFNTIEIPHITGWMIKLKDGSYETFNPETDEIIGNAWEDKEK